MYQLETWGIPFIFSIGLYLWRETIWNHLYRTPGVGRMVEKRNRKARTTELKVETEIGTINIPTFTISNAAEVDIYLFNFAVVSKTGTISRSEFEKKYSMYDMVPLQKYRRHFILPYIHTNQTKDNQISGVITSLTEMNVYVFTIKNDYFYISDLYMDFLETLRDLEVDLDLDENAPSSAPTENQELPATPPDS